jgi:hypothetical protein
MFFRKIWLKLILLYKMFSNDSSVYLKVTESNSCRKQFSKATVIFCTNSLHIYVLKDNLNFTYFWTILTMLLMKKSVVNYFYVSFIIEYESSNLTPRKYMYTLFLSSMPLSHKTTEALTDSSASKTFHDGKALCCL